MKFAVGGREVDDIVIPEELSPLGVGYVNACRSYILIKPDLVKEHWVGPGRRIPHIVGLHIEPPRPHAVIILGAISVERSGRDIEGTSMIADGWGPHATTRLGGVDADLARSRQGMTDEGPTNEIPAMVDGNPRKILKGGGDEEVVEMDPDNGRIRVETREDGIVVGHVEVASWRGCGMDVRE